MGVVLFVLTVGVGILARGIVNRVRPHARERSHDRGDRRRTLDAARRESRARARSRTSSRRCSISLAFLVALVPLVFLVVYVVQQGSEGHRAGTSSPTTSRSSTGSPGRGMGPAVVGTLLITGAAVADGHPARVLGGIYLNEYGGRRRWRGSSASSPR